jgi:hypothetical protein
MLLLNCYATKSEVSSAWCSLPKRNELSLIPRLTSLSVHHPKEMKPITLQLEIAHPAMLDHQDIPHKLCMTCSSCDMYTPWNNVSSTFIRIDESTTSNISI